MRCLMNVPYVDLADQHASIKEELLEAVGKVLDHGKFILGEEVAEFEERFAKLCGVRYALGLGSGTDALILALRVLGISAGDEVITAANSFISSASCIAYVGAKPVFVDVGEDYLINPSLIEKAITPRTKAILPVHWTGRPADMAAMMTVAKKHKLAVIEDCAQAISAEYRGKKVGSFGDIGCFSLHPLKTLNACGDGGMITTDNKIFYEQLVSLRNNGFHQNDEWRYWSNNSRLDTIHAAMMLVKLKYLDAWTQRRRDNAEFYQRQLQSISQVQAPVEQPHLRSVYHTFVIQAQRRDELKSYLAEKGVNTKVHYAIPIHLQPAAKDLGYKKSSLPVTERQSRQILSLPVSQSLQPEMLEYVVDTIRDFYGSTRSACSPLEKLNHPERAKAREGSRRRRL